MTQTLDVPAHTVSVVIPVYQGAATLPALPLGGPGAHLVSDQVVGPDAIDAGLPTSAEAKGEAFKPA